MMRIIRAIDWATLLLVALFLGMAPVSPRPHLIEKLGMLFSGTLSSPIDIFDLVMHGAPALLCVIKLVDAHNRKTKGASSER